MGSNVTPNEAVLVVFGYERWLACDYTCLMSFEDPAIWSSKLHITGGTEPLGCLHHLLLYWVCDRDHTQQCYELIVSFSPIMSSMLPQSVCWSVLWSHVPASLRAKSDVIMGIISPKQSLISMGVTSGVGRIHMMWGDKLAIYEQFLLSYRAGAAFLAILFQPTVDQISVSGCASKSLCLPENLPRMALRKRGDDVLKHFWIVMSPQKNV